MLTHADDHRIMTDPDMANCEDLSDLTWEEGATPREIRLMACMRLLLAHIEGVTDGAIVAVEGLSTKRDGFRDELTDAYDEGYRECKEDAVKALRGEK